MLIERARSVLLCIDIQEKLLPAVEDCAGLLQRAQWLISVSHDCGLPLIFSEQYPAGLGRTRPELLAIAPAAPILEKVAFSCVRVSALPESLLEREQIIVAGMETHVCVLQTVIDLLATGKTVFVVADACASRSRFDHTLALERMRAAGAILVSREMVLFELLRGAGDAQFKTLSKRYLQGEQPS
ncbi:hydrolase [Paludibacterium yongneupense]|uniref:hydrolase n=1 Tax=Paludibacterium yongneupense TaxID=400061 RepID=UPI000400975C|nr:hydrolase [Paludibacterium yongneupense]